MANYSLSSLFFHIATLLWISAACAESASRQEVPLNDGWRTYLGDPAGAEQPEFDDSDWRSVSVPHNWEDYQGYRKLSHGNLHGTAWYRRSFTPDAADREKRYFVEFEGVGSYADVWINGQRLGRHAGGRTGFQFDLTKHLKFGEENVIAVRADHPEKITDLPYVCGGCWGSPNTEGSQPLGIFRPVRLVVTSPVRIEPLGVHVWTPEISAAQARVEVNTEVKNYGDTAKRVALQSVMFDAEGTVLARMVDSLELAPHEIRRVRQTSPAIENPHLWSLDDPYLHYVKSTLLEERSPVDEVQTRFGMRWIEWPVGSVGEGVAEEREIDPQKLTELPEANNNFYTKSTFDDSASPISVDGPVRILIPSCDARSATVEVKTTVTNRSTEPQLVLITSFIRNFNGTKFVYSMDAQREFAPGETYEFRQTSPVINFPELWSAENPYLHVMETTLQHPDQAGTKRARVYDRAETSFGIRPIDGLANKGNAYVEKKTQVSSAPSEARPFLLNGNPVFLNGTCEYEHLLGGDHAFTDEQIRARMMQIKAAGFNAFREGHHPHNLRYQELCDELGLVCWTQIGAHIYFDNEPFRDNYRQAVREWVRERRNSPSLVLWGLQNESMLPEVFARELTEIIRQLDPTTSSQRKTTTCNGGRGSDWDVPQNWLGTYVGNVNDYAAAIVEQKLVGEYGQWRTHGLHQEGDWHENWADNQMLGREISEELFTYCMETRVRLAEQERGRTCGQFQWIFSTHANPGRDPSNSRDGLAPNDVGVVNYKGLLTSWGEPVDAYYMFRANYAPASTEPMVYVHSHTWPDRFDGPGVKSNLVVYSNCDEVELFNDLRASSLGVRRRGPRGTHFEWDDATIQFNVLYAEGRVSGETVARDIIVLENLPAAPRFEEHQQSDADNTAAVGGADYLYRINCGGEEYTDSHGKKWQADTHWHSWAEAYDNLDPRYASFGVVHDPIAGTLDDRLMQTYRYGRDQLRYRLEVPNGRYVVELYFIEPWYGTGGGMDCTAWRLFDVAVNGRVVLDDLDIWEEAGHDASLKKEIPITVEDGRIELDFPEVKSYQAVISAIAVRRDTFGVKDSP